MKPTIKSIFFLEIMVSNRTKHLVKIPQPPIISSISVCRVQKNKHLYVGQHMNYWRLLLGNEGSDEPAQTYGINRAFAARIHKAKM